ncbi:AMP-dependent synthetase/ligase [Penicillium malachiteum]|nr:AMP-dependent synthetase/ligase [Penicillium malachiteum]
MIFEPAQRLSLPTKDLLSYIFDNPTYDQDKPLYIDVHTPSRSISCNQARPIIRRLIAGFRAAGLQSGDCVLIHSFNDINYSMLVLAIIGAGGVFTGSNPSYTTNELSHHINAAECKFLISEPEVIEPAVLAANKAGIPNERVWIFDNLGQTVPAGMKSWKTLMDHGESDWIRFDSLEKVQNTTAARFFSSGTTGLPKAVIITHYNFIAQHEFVTERHHRPFPMSRVIAVPVFHASVGFLTHVATLKAGHETYVMRRFELQKYLEITEEKNITELALVPPIVIAILMSPISHQKPYLKKTRTALCGAAPLDKDLQERFRSMMADGSPFTQVWGMTETSCVATMFTYPEHDVTGSVGRLIPNLEAKLIDDDGNNISAYGVRGELCVRGPTVTPGYYKNNEANTHSFDADGWFKTGDIVYCDEETRKWYIVDRKKELIKVRGFQVAPPEIEAVLLSHPQIIDAAVIGITIPGADTEFPRAYVVRRPESKEKPLDEKDVQEFVLKNLARYKSLTGGVRFLDSIPRNPSGKILKRFLRDYAKKEVQDGKIRPNL